MTFACRLAVALSLMGSGLCFAKDVEVTPKDTWRSLPLVEDGKVADGWKFTGYGEFQVVDGTLRTVPDERGLGLLVYTKEKFGDCQIRLVYRTEKERSNSGVYIRIGEGILTAKQPGPAERNPDGSLTEAGDKAMKAASAESLGPWYAVHHGYEIQICDNGDPYHGTGAIYSLAKADPAVAPKPGEWRTMVITLEGDRVFVELDGQRITSFDPATSTSPERKEWYEPERGPKRPGSGYIGLQTHDPGDIVDFKEVSVRPLKATAK